MMPRVGTLLAFSGLLLAFLLSWHLGDPTPFNIVAPVAVGGKWAEAVAQRLREPPKEAR